MLLNIVDLFCGAGGMTAGILSAARRRRLKVNFVAVNHWDTAINSHSLNHPNVHHICEPVENLIPARVVPSRRLHLLAAGCECTFHSNARGGGPCNEQSRSQAWQIIRWATDILVENIQMENVREFIDWGPLHPRTHRPIKTRKGEYFQSFIAAMRGLGYTVEWRVQCAADYGDPTSRRRFILLARANRGAITWPTPSHCDPALLGSVPRAARNGGRSATRPTLKPWRTAREIIDWSLKGQSIFGRKKSLCANTMARIAAGLKKFGGPNAEPFLIILRGTSGSQLNGSARSLDEPLPTLTAGGGHATLVEPEFILPPEGFYRGNTAKSLDEPLTTITASRGRAFQLVKAQLRKVGRASSRAGSSVASPHPTPFVIGQQSCAAPRTVDSPLPTVAQAGAIRLVEPFLSSYHAGKTKRPNRNHSVDDPVPTLDTSNRFAVIEPFIYSANHGNDVKKRGQVQRRLTSLHEPLKSLTTHNGFALCEPIITQTDQTGSNGLCSQSVDRPLGTVVSKQNRLLVQPMIAKFYGTGVCQPLGEPLDTVTTRDRFMLVEFPVKSRPSTRAARPSTRRPVRVVGELDILTRMLQPHELARAHSLDGFKLTGTKEDQTAQIGNSVPKELAAAHAYQLLKSYS